jgi:tRNA 2-selenouridine synthase
MEIDIEKLFSFENTLIIDMRTKEEYKKSHIMDAINFEILNHEERKEVSVLYNAKEIDKAYLKAYEYSLEKVSKFFEIIKENKNRKIVFYCSRGGSRSGIVYNIFKDLVGIEIFKITGGYKAYRNFVNNYYKTELNKFDFRVINGLMGSGMNESLDRLNELEYNTINFSEGMDYNISQKQLDNIIFEKLYYAKSNIIYIGNEDKKFLNANIRKEFLIYLEKGDHILLETDMEFRVNNIYNKYYINCDKDFIKNIIDKTESLRKEMSNEVVDEIIVDLISGNYKFAIEKMLISYYDVADKKVVIKYKPYKKVIRFNNIEELFKNWSE